MIVDLITFLIFWLLILTGDFTIFLISFRILMKRWLWEKEIKQPWSFSISSEGWSFSAQDFNPIETFKKVLNHITGGDKSTEELVKQILNDKLKEYLKVRAKTELNKDIADKMFNKIVEDFGRENDKKVGEDGKKNNSN